MGIFRRLSLTEPKTLHLTLNNRTGMILKYIVSPDCVEETMIGHNILPGKISYNITEIIKLIVVDLSR